MNCVRWSMGDASLHGMSTSWVPGQCFGCYPCPWTKLLPMSPDRTPSRRSSLPAPADRLERLVHAGKGRDGHEAVVSLPRHVDLLREIEEHVGRVLHQDPRELGVRLLALADHGRAPRLLEELVDTRV